jgi:LysR family transcriptional activator of nhaA
MAALNYKHLRYFWAVARAGSIARASEQLHVTAQSISGQLAELQEALGAQLLERAGRGLAVTEPGRRVLSYADEIFALGDELLEVARDAGARKVVPFRIGIADSVPKSITHRVVAPALDLGEPVRLICREGRLAALLADLAVHRLDMVIADRSLPSDVNVRGFSHLLGASAVTVFGADALVRTLRGGFPASLDRAPFLLPGESVAIRPRLAQWFEAQDVHPRVVGEFDDSALLKAFGQAGAGLFVAPTAIADYVCAQYGVRAVGRIDAVVEELYAITTERRIRHPATVAISNAARRQVYAAGAPRGPARRTGRGAPGRPRTAPRR